jgi:hypothetical protein
MEHFDLQFEDCTAPPKAVARRFLQIAEGARGLVAIHCKAGLGRTGTLIALYMMKHHGFTARAAIGWLRIMRPGSVIGEQQQYLCEIERKLGCLASNPAPADSDSLRRTTSAPDISPHLDAAADDAAGAGLRLRRAGGSLQEESLGSPPLAATSRQRGSGSAAALAKQVVEGLSRRGFLRSQRPLLGRGLAGASAGPSSEVRCPDTDPAAEPPRTPLRPSAANAAAGQGVPEPEPDLPAARRVGRLQGMMERVGLGRFPSLLQPSSPTAAAVAAGGEAWEARPAAGGAAGGGGGGFRLPALGRSRGAGR